MSKCNDQISDLSPRLRVCSFESRRADEMAALILRNGGVPTVAPSMQEVTLDDNAEVISFSEDLLHGKIDLMIFLTGVGATALMEIASRRYSRDELLRALEQCVVIVRGPKPTAVLRQWNLRIDHRAPEPNTWKEVLATLDDAQVAIAGKTIAVQEYGQPNEELYAALRERGAIVRPVPVYCWRLPDDVGPLQSAIRETCRRGFDILLFTSAQQVRHVVHVAEEIGLRAEWCAAARTVVIGSIGPTCSEALRVAGLPVDWEPSHPKMGPLVREVLEAAPKILATRHGAHVGP